MKKLFFALVLFCCAAAAFAQTESDQQWVGAGAATRFGASGLTLSYGQQDLLAPGTDARFSASYFNAPYDASGFSAEVSADALAYTYDPDPERGPSLTAASARVSSYKQTPTITTTPVLPRISLTSVAWVASRPA